MNISVSVDRANPVEEAPSMRAALDALAVGECYSRAIRLDDASPDAIREAANFLRTTLQPAAARAGRTGKTFRIETGEFITTSKNVAVCVIVTRTG